jgi:hypothetical protein
LLLLTGGLTLASAVFAYWRYRDVFHPAFLIGPLLCWPYCLSPLLLEQLGALQRYLPMWQMPDVQIKFLVGVASILLGIFAAGGPRRIAVDVRIFSPVLRNRMRWAGVLLGMGGAAAYLYTVQAAGGFDTVYGVAHGRSMAGSGYVRDLVGLLVPGLLLVLYSNSGRPIPFSDKLLMTVFAAPLAFHGLISASRGITFLIGVTLFVGWYMMRLRRPRLALLLAAGPAFAFLIFFLAANRGQIHLGSGFENVSAFSVQKFLSKKSSGQEYIYGSGTILQAERSDSYQWGALYLIHWFVKPIPKEIWPTKYEDASRYFKIPSNDEILEQNTYRLGWAATGGAAPGVIADMWLQFWWFMVIPLFLVGYLYGWTWSRALSRGGLWIIAYVMFLSHSIYFTQQDVDALFNQIFYVFAISWLVWLLLVKRSWLRAGWHWSRAQSTDKMLSRYGGKAPANRVPDLKSISPSF